MLTGGKASLSAQVCDMCIKTSAPSCTKVHYTRKVPGEMWSLQPVQEGGVGWGVGGWTGGKKKKRVTLLVPGCGCSLTLLATTQANGACSSVQRRSAVLSRTCQIRQFIVTQCMQYQRAVDPSRLEQASWRAGGQASKCRLRGAGGQKSQSRYNSSVAWRQAALQVHWKYWGRLRVQHQLKSLEDDKMPRANDQNKNWLKVQIHKQIKSSQWE